MIGLASVSNVVAGVAALADLNAMGQLFFAPAHPVWSIAVFAADLWAVHALVTHGGQRLFRK